MHKKAFTLLLIGFFVFAFLFHFVGVSNILQVFKTANMSLILLAIIFQFLMVISWNLKWELLFRYLKINMSFSKLFPVLLVGNFGNAVTPGSRIGGEPFRFYYLRKENIKSKDALTTILLERAYNLLAFILLAFFSILITIIRVALPLWLLILMLLSLMFVLALTGSIFYIFYKKEKGILITKKFSDKLLKKIYKFHAVKFHGKRITFKEYQQHINRSINHFFNEVLSLGEIKKLWIYGVFLSLLYFFQYFLLAYLMFWAVGVKIPFYLVVAFITIVNLIGLLTMVPSGAGVFELILVVFIKSVGASLPQAVAGVLLVRGLYYIFALGAGYLSILWLERK